MSGSHAGVVAALWRYPVKSMMGEELNATAVTERGLAGDRAYALIDAVTGKVVSAKEPRKWSSLFDFRAAYASPVASNGVPPVRITLPDGRVLVSDEDDAGAIISSVLGRDVTLTRSAPEEATLEEYWPDIDGLDHRDVVTDEAIPPQTFFDAAAVHVLTTSTLDRLRELYPGGRFEVRRFRPNVVIDIDAVAFAENEWVGEEVAVGDDVRLRIDKLCPRCVMTTLAQYDLPKDPGILRAAAQHNGANVGVYASVVRGGTVRRGDAVYVGAAEAAEAVA